MNKGICRECGEYKKIDIHHIDGDHSNDVPVNRQPLCRVCHLLAHSKMREPAEHLPIDWKPEPLPWEEVRRQYFAYFPRAYTR